MIFVKLKVHINFFHLTKRVFSKVMKKWPYIFDLYVLNDKSQGPIDVNV